MTLTPVGSQWTNGESLNAVNLHARIDVPVDAIIAVLDDDVVQTAGIGITAATGWGTVTQSWEPHHGVMYLTLTATRTGSTLTATSAGNIGNLLVATLTDHRPSRTVAGTFKTSTTSGGSRLNSVGGWYVEDAHPTSTIGTGDVITSSYIYPL